MDFRKQDWKKCVGQVFEIYRRKGPGFVKVGDQVGLYYPRNKNWIGCAGQPCGQAGCPGQPTNKFGFHTKCKWNSCQGEVFRIFVKGKKMGATVNSDDDVALYYPSTRRWCLGFSQTSVHFSTAPRQLKELYASMNIHSMSSLTHSTYSIIIFIFHVTHCTPHLVKFYILLCLIL